MVRDDRIQQTIRYALLRARLSQESKVTVALSGGLDSQVLTHLLRTLPDKERPSLNVVHVDHQLRPESGNDAERVAALCQSWGLTCEVQKVDVAIWERLLGQGTEAAARAARYAALAHVFLRTGSDAVVTAHTRSDQVETVLLRLISGAGLDGISGIAEDDVRSIRLIPATDPAPDSWLRIRMVRPLLSVLRNELEVYAELHGLEPVEDATNQSLRYRRNQIRHQVVPVIESIEPGFHSAVGRTADLLQNDAAFLTQIANEWIDQNVTLEHDVALIPRAEFARLAVPIQRRVTLQAVYTLAIDTRVSGERVDAGCAAIIRGRIGADVEFPDNIHIVIDYDVAVFTRRGTEHAYDILRLRYPGPLMEPAMVVSSSGEYRLLAGWILRVAAENDEDDWQIRTRRKGDRIVSPGGGVSVLRKRLIDQKIPAYVRDYVPLLVEKGVVHTILAHRNKEVQSGGLNVEVRQLEGGQ